MCITAKEMNETMEAIQEWKRIKEEAEDNITALNAKAIEFLNENRNDCLATNSKGKEILQFIGNMCKATLSVQSRETLNKEKVKEFLNDEDYGKVSKVSTYPVLRIS